MRRTVPLLLIGIGAFLIVSAALLRFYAYPKVAVAPKDENSVTRLEATGATIFDVPTLAEKQTDLKVASTTRGDVKATDKSGGDTRVWASTQTIWDSNGAVLSQDQEQTSFHAHSAIAKNCCGDFSESTQGQKDAVKRTGLVFKWPFDAGKKTYKIWNGSVGQAVDAKFVKQTKLDGLTVYEYDTDIVPTRTGDQDVPGKLVGQPTVPSVAGEKYYSNQQQYFVEPATGAIIKRIDHQKNTVRVGGVDKITTTEATIAYTDQQVKKNADEFKGKSAALKAVHGWGPLLALILGLLALLGGVGLTRLPGFAGTATKTPAAAKKPALKKPALKKPAAKKPADAKKPAAKKPDDAKKPDASPSKEKAADASADKESKRPAVKQPVSEDSRATSTSVMEPIDKPRKKAERPPARGRLSQRLAKSSKASEKSSESASEKADEKLDSKDSKDGEKAD